MVQKQNLENLSSLQFNASCALLVDTLCQPLFKNFGITHFGYIRILEDGKMLRIANNESWTRMYFQHEFYNDINLYDMNHLALNCKEDKFSRFCFCTMI